jgi:AraC-like DNA-binding protein
MNTILLIASIFGFVLTSILFFKKSTNAKAAFFLGSFYFIISMYALQTYVVNGNYLNQFSWFFIWPLLVYHLIYVLVYFYFVTVINDEFRWKNTYLILFVPFILGLVDVIYVYTSPKEVYNQLLNAAISNAENRFSAHYWLLSLNEHYLIRHLWQLVSLFIILPQLLSFLKEGHTHKLKKTLNKWLLFFWAVQVLMAVFTILHAVDNFMETSVFRSLLGIKNGSVALTFLLYLIVFIIGIIPIYFPTILHGYPRSIKIRASAAAPIQEPIKNSVPEPIQNSHPKSSVDLKFGLNINDIQSKLEVLIQKKVFLDQDFTVTTCAQDLEIPAHHLSYFINNRYGQSFTAYKNQLRMNHAKQLISNGFLENGTMEGLASECGFANRSSFSKVFKIATNQSPSDYAKILNQK